VRNIQAVTALCRSVAWRTHYFLLSTVAIVGCRVLSAEEVGAAYEREIMFIE